MDPLPCGCDKLQEAKKIDGANREIHVTAGREWQREWRCPIAGGRGFPRDTSDLSPRGKRALELVEQLTGTGKLTTCPCAYTRRVDIFTAFKWRERREKHWLQATAPRALPALLIAQVEAIDSGCARRQSHELERMRAEAKKHTNGS